jgi:hypothetical protein
MSRAALLRRLQPGAKLRLVYRSSDGPKNLAREVIRATSYSLLMKGPDYPRSRVQLAKATIRATPNGFELLWPEVPSQCPQKLLRYEWVTPSPDQLELKGQSQ